MLKLILESFDKNRLIVFEKLKFFRNIGVLGGGTALALQIGHRVSFDFDIFTHQKLASDLWEKIKNVFGKNSEKLLDSEDQLNLLTPENVTVTFFYDDYKNLFDPIKTEAINLMNPKDIATNKAFTIGRRPKWRDYVDLYFLLKNKHIFLEELIKLSEKKFGSDFSEKLFLEQLVYWNDIGDYVIEFTGSEIPAEKIKRFLEDEVKEIFKEVSLQRN